MNLKEMHDFCQKNGLKWVDIKFTDMPGTWQHFTMPLHEIDEGAIREGVGFDGSSIRGFQNINESDMILMLDLKTAIADPFSTNTLSIVADIKDPITQKFYSRDPRFVAKKAEEYLRKCGAGDHAYFGPEPEFFVFDHVRYGQETNHGFYHIDAEEGIWNSGKDEENLGNKIRHKEGYFPVAPSDTQQNLRNEMIDVMEKCGITVERQHHEVATAGQAEIDIRFNSLTVMGDNVMLFKYIVKNIAAAHGKTATFMPKPLFNDNGSGMHTHQSIWKDGKNLFAGDEYAGLSKMGLHYIGGILKHAPALTAFCSPTTNSYKRLVPGFEAPVNLVYSGRNRSAAIRIPTYSANPKSKRIEYRSPDPSCNPYLAFSAMLMAGLDGIKHKIDPGEPTEVNLYDLSPEEAKRVKSLPTSLPESVAALRSDCAFLLEGGVFTEDLIEMWIEYVMKRESEVRKRPHPFEFMLYYDV
ncbi:MAG TPA: type I glutamate--ammonia ligase [Candidatus Nanoarchaeia archaeon]|nr:type I glutamate--ammonia ligase [Candidatus Nanoarchaeia archaeon]